ncbi:MAG: hypothetical protein LBE13_06275 [Bacteroidales bacterium]|jgi:hypothetical protein|nr:hypothetical protein [Bacteroidales bacterium]
MTIEQFNYKLYRLKLGEYDISRNFISLIVAFVINSFNIRGSVLVLETGNLLRDMLSDGDIEKKKIQIEFQGNELNNDRFSGEFYITGFDNISENNTFKQYNINFVDEFTYANLYTRIQTNLEGTTQDIFNKSLELLNIDEKTPQVKFNFSPEPTLKYKFFANNMNPYDFLDNFLRYSCVDGKHIDTLFFRRQKNNQEQNQNTLTLNAANIINSAVSFVTGTDKDLIDTNKLSDTLNDYFFYITNWSQFAKGKCSENLIDVVYELVSVDKETSLRKKYEIIGYEINSTYNTEKSQDYGHYGTSTVVYDFGTGRYTETPLMTVYNKPEDVREELDINDNTYEKIKPLEDDQEILANERYIFSTTGFTLLTEQDFHNSPIGLPTSYGQSKPKNITEDDSVFYKAKGYVNIYPNLGREMICTFIFNSCPIVSIGDIVNITSKEIDKDETTEIVPWIDGKWIVISITHSVTQEKATSAVTCCRCAPH